MIPWLLLLGGCPAPDPAEAFARDVAPWLERGCLAGSCHGVAPGAEAAGEVIDRGRLYVDVDAAGRIVDLEAARAAALRAVDAADDPDASTLLRKPLPAAWGGLPHLGGVGLTSPEDPAYAAIRAWIALEPRGGEDPAPLDALEARFADEVQPALIAMGCATASCHGPEAAVPFHLDPGVRGRLGVTATRANHRAARTMLSLGPDPAPSRLLRKALPISAGGIPHRGGNDTFLLGPEDPRAAAIRAWACAERAAAGAGACGDRVTGVVFVGGRPAAEAPFDLDGGVGETDLFLATVDEALRVVAVENLTAALHTGPADVRDPAVSPDGGAVLFTLREPEGHRVWRLDLDTREATRLTHGPGHDRDPAWGPDDTAWFTSTRAGGRADDGAVDADLYELDLRDGRVTRRTWAPHVERRPTWLHVGEEAGGELGFTLLRDVFADRAHAHPFRVPPGLDTEVHQHFGTSAPERRVDALEELADGRYAVILGDLDDAWGVGRLAILDRNLGPELGPGETPALPGYLPPLTRLDAALADPAALPDGSLLVAASDGADPPRLRLERVVLEEGPTGPRVARREVLLALDGASARAPAPVVRGPLPERHGEDEWDPEAETGRVVHGGLAVLDAILAHLPPAGGRVPREDIVAVRLIEPVPLPPGAPGRPSGVAPARVLAELPVAADGSFQVEVPAGSVIRFQALDADGLAVGHAHDRWYDVAPGQTLRLGIRDLATYRARCAACHGADDGDPAHAIGGVQAVSGASITLGRYEGGDPRRPLPAPLAGPATRREVDFEVDLLPILAACAACHDAPPLDLRPEAAYAALVGGGWAAGGTARTSPLAEVLLGRELDAADFSAPASPHGGAPAAAVAELLLWLDLGAAPLGSAP